MLTFREIFSIIIKTIIVISFVVFIIWMICYGSNQITLIEDEKIWNNGICTECEKGNYKFKNSIYKKYSSYEYFYACDKCDHVIKTRHSMK